MRVIVSGSTGLIGRALVAALEAEGHRVTRLVRQEPGPHEVGWDPAAGILDARPLEGHDAAVHLSGHPVAGRWTPEHKQEVWDSRVRSTGLLAGALASLERPPAVLASGSAVGYYGDRGDEELVESSGPGTGFLSEVCVAWEAATAPAEAAGIRVCHLRTGLVLSTEGDLLAAQLAPFRAGMGGPTGPGTQYMSWIAVHDEVGAILHLLSNPNLRGPVNVTAPSPVTNREWSQTLGRVVGQPATTPAPVEMLRQMLGDEAVDEMILAGQRVIPEALLASGYEFRHPQLEGALRALIG